jgi:hypothetical protein
METLQTRIVPEEMGYSLDEESVLVDGVKRILGYRIRGPSGGSLAFHTMLAIAIAELRALVDTESRLREAG